MADCKTPGSRAYYASHPGKSRGREHPEPESATRTAFQRDRDRIIHSTAFRRLKHKTQVFVYHEGDHYRTRLTHSLEVAQIARSISRALGLDEDLAEALALAHDFGHPPFGHVGEDQLAECMAAYDGFDHNAQTLRIVTKLERRYAEFDGLNLTWESLEGIVKHNGPVITSDRIDALHAIIQNYININMLDLNLYPSAEAQVAAISDDIAYNNHDIDDGLRADLFAVEDLRPLPLVGDVFQDVMTRYPGLELSRLVHESVRRLISLMIEDVIAETRRRAAQSNPQTANDVRTLGSALVGFSGSMAHHDRELKSFLKKGMYEHYKVTQMRTKVRRVLADLFSLFIQKPETLPPFWRAQCCTPESDATARVVCDFIAGMTDRFAFEEHQRLFTLDTRI
jgi:dGTPase